MPTRTADSTTAGTWRAAARDSEAALACLLGLGATSHPGRRSTTPRVLSATLLLVAMLLALVSVANLL